MAADSREDDAADVSTPTEFDLADVARMVAAVRKLDAKWKEPKRPLGLAPADWRPNLIAGKRVCHVHAVSALREHWVQRMSAARKAGHTITIATPLSGWYSSDTLMVADGLGAEAIVLRQRASAWHAKKYANAADLIAGENLIVDPAAVKSLGRKALALARGATSNHNRGRLFEKFLCFFFSQVTGFELHEHNYRTETEEIDAIFLNRRLHGQCWPSGPLVLISGKNTKAAAGAPAVTSLASKMQNRRGMCKLGFLCSAGTISSDARNHELRYSREDNLMVLIDGKDFDSLLDKAHRLDAELERLVVNASLR